MALQDDADDQPQIGNVEWSRSAPLRRLSLEARLHMDSTARALAQAEPSKRLAAFAAMAREAARLVGMGEADKIDIVDRLDEIARTYCVENADEITAAIAVAFDHPFVPPRPEPALRSQYI